MYMFMRRYMVFFVNKMRRAKSLNMCDGEL